MPTARAYLGVAVVNDILYAIGGFDGQNWLSTVEEYTPIGYGTAPPIIQINSPGNQTYNKVTVNFTVNRNTDWIGYSLDNHANVTLIEETNYLIYLKGTQHNSLRQRQPWQHGQFKHSFLFCRYYSSRHSNSCSSKPILRLY